MRSTRLILACIALCAVSACGDGEGDGCVLCGPNEVCDTELLTCVPIIDCTLSRSVCGEHGFCEVGTGPEGTDACECELGYEGNACRSCAPGFQDNDGDGECVLDCFLADLQCDPGHICSDEDGTPRCVCPTGHRGDTCAECIGGFADRAGDGHCVPVTCEAAELTCPDHGFCFDADQEPRCLCNIGYQGALCDQCASTHQRTETAECMMAPDPAQYAIAGATDPEFGPHLVAIDMGVGTTVPVLQMEEPVIDLAYDPRDKRLFGLVVEYPRRIVEIDPVTGAQETLRSLSGYHRAAGLGFDRMRRILFTHASIGAGRYFLATDVDTGRGAEEEGNGQAILNSESVFTYDQTADAIVGLTPDRLRIFEQPAPDYNTVWFEYADLGVRFAALGVDMAPESGKLLFSGHKLLTENEWLEEYCQRLAGLSGVDTSGHTFSGEYSYDDVPDGHVMGSVGSGPTLVAIGTYGNSRSSTITVSVETTNQQDVVCVVTREDPFHLVVRSSAKLAALVIVSREPTVSLEIEPGFSPPASDPTPVHAYVVVEPIHPSIENNPLAVVESTDRLSAVGIGNPGYTPALSYTPTFGVIEKETGVTSKVVTLEGVELTGGLVRLE